MCDVEEDFRELRESTATFSVFLVIVEFGRTDHPLTI